MATDSCSEVKLIHFRQICFFPFCARLFLGHLLCIIISFGNKPGKNCRKKSFSVRKVPSSNVVPDGDTNGSFRTSSSPDSSFLLVSGVETGLTLMSDHISNSGSSISLGENPSNSLMTELESMTMFTFSTWFHSYFHSVLKLYRDVYMFDIKRKLNFFSNWILFLFI